jgi:tetratricopeptide (TPR) repeat protein
MSAPDQPASPTKTPGISALFSPRESVTCRYCGSTNVRPSSKASARVEYVVYRCRACKQHFKVFSTRPRLHAYLGVGVLVLILVGGTLGFFLSSGPEVAHPSHSDAQDPVSLSQVQTGAQHGDPQAQYELGLRYWHNEQYKEALPLLRAAANRGHAEAQYQMGMAYLEGRGIVQNYRGAMEYFSKAAEQGHLEAEYRLGLFYRDGLAAPMDREMAYVWLNVAAAQGHLDALGARERLAQIMSREEIVRAQETSAQMHQKLSTRAPGQPKPAPAAPAAPTPPAAAPAH